ncbi:MAG: hypothetical protein IKO87_00005, partial [Kiritimatiellae bacterium]|nr:hypothetical protein [Kiritimatiellia bacterium]
MKKFFAEHPVFTITAKQQKDKEGNTTTEITEAECNILPLDSKGQINSKYGDSAFLNIVQDNGADALALHIAVFIRVKNSKGKTVDLVPADVTDDKRFNDMDNGYWSLAFDRNKGPLLRFDAGETIKFTMADFESLDRGIAYNPAGIMCPDPRFNHAPENWISKSANNASTWLNNCGAANRDGDIFMFVSDQGYLQSIYELAFLPNLSEMRHYGDSVLGAYSIREMASYPSAIGDCTNGSLMWNTYRCYRNGSLARHDFEDIGLVLNDCSFRVNPCSQSVDALMAAFANTPYDWWAASTNNDEIANLDSASAFNSKYAFCDMNASAGVAWEDLEKIATNFRDAVRVKKGDWEAAFDSLDWIGDDSDFCGADSADLQKLSTADRKFLYGFWRDSFANRQQLFLIFVRA